MKPHPAASVKASPGSVGSRAPSVSANTAAAFASLERVRALRNRGVVRGYHAEVDLAAIGRPVQALIAVRIRPPSREVIEAFRDWVRQLPETVGVVVVPGAEDFLIPSAVADTNALYAFVIDRLTQRPELADVRTSVVYSTSAPPSSPPSTTNDPRR